MLSTIAINAGNDPSENPFFKPYGTPFETPPFNQIKTEHYLPAFEEGVKQQKAEIEAIITNSAEPTFENTIEALEKSGKLLTKVSGVFYNLTSAHTNDDLQALSKTITPMLTKHNDEINLNPELFEKIKKLYEKINKFNLAVEQKTLLEKYYKNFIRGGANLNGEDKERFKKINEELSLLSLRFGENLLKENNAFELIIEDEKDLAGLPKAVKNSAAEAAIQKGHEGKWVFTLHKPSLIPFLQYSQVRPLREKMFKAYINRGNNNNENDNKEILNKIASLRVERANILGYKTHADFILEENMAKNPKTVLEFLNKLWEPALNVAKHEAEELQQMIYKDGGDFNLEAWDWWYYSEKLRKDKYDLDEEMLRPYFKLENVINGAFEVAGKLYGINFAERFDIPIYHEDVRVFEVKEADGKHIGIFYTDYFPRASKRGGAWMNSYRKQSRLDDVNINPIICNVGNFSKPSGNMPALLSFEEVNTLFHELGHALHGLLSNSTYPSISGTSVPRDFVELPSQIMENWASHPDVLKMFAKHYQLNDPMPDDLIKKIVNASKFNQGFATVEYLAASFLDMDWHTLTDSQIKETLQFEKESLSKIGLIPEIESRYQSTNFAHIFSGGYSSGYYSYIWAEVLDADAFEAFKENGIFDKVTATAFRQNILEKGGIEDPMVLYKRFRGAEPKVEPLLERRGLK
jgi:peptidyl-dipeptidase Dcp